MSMGIRITISGLPEAQARFRSLTGLAMSRAMVRAMTESMEKVTRRVDVNVSGAVLRVRTSRLRQSLQYPTVSLDGKAGRLGTNVEYAAIHEYGGKTSPHRIAAIRSKTLAFVPTSFIGPVRQTTRASINKKAYFKGDFGPVYPRFVMHPGSVMPARPFMRPALQDSLADIRAAFTREFEAALDGKA